MLINNKKIITVVTITSILFIFMVPILSYAVDYLPLIQCGLHPTVADGVVTGACTFGDAIDTINRIMNWIISSAGVIFAISFIWGGFLYMTSGTSLGDREKARRILWSTLQGFVIMLVAWLIVYTILKAFDAGDYVFKFIGN